MNGIISETALELLAIFASALGSIILTGIGIMAEQAAVNNVLAGQLTVGLWEFTAGGILLFAGIYMLGYKEFSRRFTNFSVATE